MKKLAMIGCGGIGEYHLEHFVKYDDVELVGFCDIIESRAQAFAEKAGRGAAFTCYKAMYDAVAPDMVFICVPPTQHGDIEFETIRRGIHLFVEKPVALCLDLAKQIRDAIETAGLVSAVGFQLRYDTLNDAVKAHINEHEVIYIDCSRMGGVPGAPWWKSRALSGGQIVEQTIHQFDTIRYVYGEPESVFTMGTRGFVKGIPDFDTEDASATVIKFKSGALGVVATGCYAEKGDAFDSKVVFSAADSRVEFQLASKVSIYGAAPRADVESAEDATVIKGDGGLRATGDGPDIYTCTVDYGTICDRIFVDAVISGDKSKIRSPYSDAVKTLAFTLACNESMDTKLPVTVDFS